MRRLQRCRRSGGAEHTSHRVQHAGLGWDTKCRWLGGKHGKCLLDEMRWQTAEVGSPGSWDGGGMVGRWVGRGTSDGPRANPGHWDRHAANVTSPRLGRHEVANDIGQTCARTGRLITRAANTTRSAIACGWLVRGHLARHTAAHAAGLESIFQPRPCQCDVGSGIAGGSSKTAELGGGGGHTSPDPPSW